MEPLRWGGALCGDLDDHGCLRVRNRPVAGLRGRVTLDQGGGTRYRGALWALWMTVSACGAGGYIAGRMRKPLAESSSHERGIRDGAHGLVVWAVGALLVAFITSSSLMGAAKTAATGAAAVAGGAGALISQQADPLASALDGIMRMAIRMNIPQAEAEKRIHDAFARLNQAKETAKQAAEKARNRRNRRLPDGGHPARRGRGGLSRGHAGRASSRRPHNDHACILGLRHEKSPAREQA